MITHIRQLLLAATLSFCTMPFTNAATVELSETQIRKAITDVAFLEKTGLLSILQDKPVLISTIQTALADACRAFLKAHQAETTNILSIQSSLIDRHTCRYQRSTEFHALAAKFNSAWEISTIQILLEENPEMLAAFQAPLAKEA